MATLRNSSLKKSLASKAEENTTVTKGTANNRRTLKEGVPSEHSRRHLDGTNPTVGVSVGTTLNMGDYESLRVDTWITDAVHESETTKQAYERITSIATETLQKIVEQYK